MAKVSKHGPTMKVNWNRIDALLEKESITKQELSEMLGFSKWYLSSARNGKIKGLPFNVIKQISDMFCVKFEDLLAGSKTEPELEAEKSGEDTMPLQFSNIIKQLSDLSGVKSEDFLADSEGEDTMTLVFSDDEFRRIVELTKHFGLTRTTDLFHKLLNDFWLKYRKETLKEELERLPEAILLKRYIASVFGTDKYDKDDLIRKVVDDAMRRYQNG